MKRKDKKNLKYGSDIALKGIFHLVFLGILKGTIGYFTGIVVLTADALASFADFLSLLAAYIGLRLSQHSATKNFKYGYYKAETLAGFVAALFIIYFGIEILFQSIARITTRSESQLQYLAVISVLVSVFFSLRLAKHLGKAGKQVNSIALTNNAKDKKMDVLVQIGVLLSIGANYFQVPYFEGAIGVMISVFTLKVGFQTAKESLFYMLDYFGDQKLLKQVRDTIHSKSRIVKSIKDVRMRRAGTFIFGEGFLEINPYAQTQDIRHELKYLRREVLKLSPYLKDFLLFVDIPFRTKIKVAIPVVKNNKLKSIIATSFDKTNAFIFIEIKNKKISHYYGKPFKFKQNDISGITKYLTKENINIIINNDMHTLLYYELRRLNNIDVYPYFGNIPDVKNTVTALLIDT
jgi:cation diffusion facilitator family transporter